MSRTEIGFLEPDSLWSVRIRLAALMQVRFLLAGRGLVRDDGSIPLTGCGCTGLAWLPAIRWHSGDAGRCLSGDGFDSHRLHCEVDLR